jgi:hypothetical protein
MTKHATLVGGSTADRLMHCPGNFQLRMRLPDLPEVSSSYALHGSAMHAVMDRGMPNYVEGFPPLDLLIESFQEYIGDWFLDRELTEEDFRSCIEPALIDLDRLMTEYGGGFRVLGNEMRVTFPGIPGAFGTTDLLIGNDKWTILVDYKFGANEVTAVVKDEQGEYVNAQLQFYLAASINTAPKLFTKKRFAVAIIQPRVLDGETLTHTAVSRKEVSIFVEDLAATVAVAVGPSPPLATGDHCKWCPAFAICPKQSEAVFSINALGEIQPAIPVPADSDDGSYGDFLAKAKRISDMFKGYAKEIDDQLHRYLEGGGHVPGWKLKYREKLRKWNDDENLVAKELEGLGFEDDQIWISKLRTFKETDQTAKRLGVRIDHLRYKPESTETVPVPESDNAPAVDRDTSVNEFAAALKLLQSS